MTMIKTLQIFDAHVLLIIIEWNYQSIVVSGSVTPFIPFDKITSNKLKFNLNIIYLQADWLYMHFT